MNLKTFGNYFPEPRGYPQEVKILKFARDFLAHPALPKKDRQELLELAALPGNDTWQPGSPLTEVRHCHYTNTKDEVEYALGHDYNFFEGDVRLEAGVRRLPGLDHWREPIMGHDPDDVNGLSLNEWLEVGKASGRGLKLDIKQAAAVPKIIECVKAHAIDDQKLIFNGDVLRGPGAPGPLAFLAGRLFQDMTMDQNDLRDIRQEFPQALISLGAYTGGQPQGTTYSPKQLDKLGKIADEVGGPISFPLRAEFVTPEVVAQLKPHGFVSIWNDPSTYSPADLQAETRRFREMGVDGMIDLRNTPHPGPPRDP